MTADNIEYLPIWKKGASAEEFLLELAMVARKHPEAFGKIVIVRQETLPSGNTLTRFNYYQASTIEAVGLLEVGKIRTHEESQL